MSEQRYCVDCRWYRPWQQSDCWRSAGETSLVTGRPLDIPRDTIDERYGKKLGNCGQEGRYWEDATPHQAEIEAARQEWVKQQAEWAKPRIWWPL